WVIPPGAVTDSAPALTSPSCTALPVSDAAPLLLSDTVPLKLLADCVSAIELPLSPLEPDTATELPDAWVSAPLAVTDSAPAPLDGSTIPAGSLLTRLRLVSAVAPPTEPSVSAPLPAFSVNAR